MTLIPFFFKEVSHKEIKNRLVSYYPPPPPQKASAEGNTARAPTDVFRFATRIARQNEFEGVRKCVLSSESVVTARTGVRGT